MNDTALDFPRLEKDLAQDIPSELPLPAARTLDEFLLDVATNGGNLLGKRFLCRGGGLLFVGPTGIGKSVLVLMFVILFALGRLAFGLKPARSLRTLIIQAENDDGDIAEMRDGIFEGLNLGEDERRAACENVKIVSENSMTGADFILLVAQLIEQYKPDLLVIDPLLAFLGDSVNEQKAVSSFLRNGLNPILQTAGCALILIHHTNKPPQGKEKADWKAGDFAYLGTGSAELANWARAVIAMRSVGSHDIFQLVLGKRGKRAGIVDREGKPKFEIVLRHSTQGICWEPVPEGELPTLGKTDGPSVEECLENFYALIPSDKPISQGSLFLEASKHGFGEKRARQFIKVLIERGRFFEWKTKRSGTNPGKSYSRTPQPQQEKLP